MRTCLAISVLVHAAILLWLVLVPAGRPFAPAQAEPILVDLLPAQDTRETKPEEAKSPQKPEPPKPELQKPESQKPEPQKAEPQKADSGPKSPPSKAAQDDLEDRAATAARLAWELNLPTDTVVNLAAPPSESKSNLTSEEIGDLKAQVGKCWSAPDRVPHTPGFEAVIRIALKPDGTLGAAPQLVSAPASISGPPLVASAKHALQQCQPYAMLPADKYQDWRVLDLTFRADGPAALSAPRRNAATQ